MPAPLSRIRVLDLSRVFAGPFAGQMLADFGADVIKVERPRTGDETRHHGQRIRDSRGNETDGTAAFLSMNRGKRSVTVDIAKPEGQDIVRALAAQSDVLIENFKAGELGRYRLDYASLHALNPRLVYCSITGFGQTGPRSREPGYDLAFQAMSGIMSITGHPDGAPGEGPQRVGYSVSDITASYHAVIAILGALYARETGACAGQHIDVALLDSQIAAASHVAMQYLLSGVQPARVGSGSHFMAPYQVFHCSDHPLVILCGNDAQFRSLAAALGRADLAQDPRCATNPERLRHRQWLAAEIQAVVGTRSRSAWVVAFQEAGVPCAPIYEFAQTFDDPQVRHRNLVMSMPFAATGTLPMIANPLRFSETSVVYERPPPGLGEHTDEVCTGLLGMSPEQLAALRRDGVL